MDGKFGSILNKLVDRKDWGIDEDVDVEVDGYIKEVRVDDEEMEVVELEKQEVNVNDIEGSVSNRLSNDGSQDQLAVSAYEAQSLPVVISRMKERASEIEREVRYDWTGVNIMLYYYEYFKCFTPSYLIHVAKVMIQYDRLRFILCYYYI